ncbi:MAG: hypothetical protein KGY76_05285 [Candidatus Thermoplasmatota archaeon]|nr:hypothetical protein [Candidatus Thermoplasmatota archaeon]
MTSPDRIQEDERGVMIFALIAVVILLLSIVTAYYHSRIQLQRQEKITDTLGIKEVEVKIDRIERELESAAWEAGQKAVEVVKNKVLLTGKRYTLNELRYRIGENTTRIFDRYFESNVQNRSELDNYKLHMHLRPLPKNRTDIEMIPLYMRVQNGNGSSWKEVPGFFRVRRTVHVDIENTDTGTFSSRKMMIDKTVKTNFFILAERMNHFRLSSIRKMTNTMLFAYLYMKIYDCDEDFGGNWFESSFDEHFNTGWLNGYDGLSGNFSGGEEREKAWEEDQDGFVEGFDRDIGERRTSDLLTGKELEAIFDVAILLEQIRAFRSYDPSLSSEIAEHFKITERDLLNYLGNGEENRVNLEALIIKLYQEKGDLSDRLLYSGPFLNRTTKGGFLSPVTGNQRWINTSFGILKRLLQGKMLDEGSWRYEDFSGNVRSLSGLKEDASYLRALVSLHSGVMEETLQGFRVDEDEVKKLVEGKINSLEPLDRMKDIEMIGPNGIDKVVGSVLYTARNLSMSLGFEETPSSEIGAPLYYLYFVSDWGYERSVNGKTEAGEMIKEEQLWKVIQGKIKNELETRKDGFNMSREAKYDEVVTETEGYNETEWYEEDDEDWKDIWSDLNGTLDPFENLSSSQLFDETSQYNTTKVLYDNYTSLEEKIEDIKEEIDWMEPDPKNHTLGILKSEKNFTEIKWQFELYDHLLEGKGDEMDDEKLRYVDKYINSPFPVLNNSYNWTVTRYEVASDIEIPPEDSKGSVGYAAIGRFTEDLKRDFLGPLNHSNSFNLFKRVQRNIVDLAAGRDGKERSRLDAILMGKGDPYSETFDNSEGVKEPLHIDGDDIHSDEIEEIKTSYVDKSYERSVTAFKNIGKNLSERADRLMNSEVDREPYSEYGHASFYRTADRFLSPLTEMMERYRRSTSTSEKDMGFLYEFDGKKRSLPVVGAPLGGLTVWDNKSTENSSSYTFDLDVEMISDDDFVECYDIFNVTGRLYEGDLSSSHEWMNPSSKDHMDYYNTVLLGKLKTPDFDIEVSTADEKVLASEKYSDARFKRTYDSEEHEVPIELLTPMPLLQSRYVPRSTGDLEISNISMDRNVFNSSKEKLNLSFEAKNSRSENFSRDLIVDLLEKDGERNVSPEMWGRENYYSAVEETGDITLLGRKKVKIKNGTEEQITLSFDLEGIGFPDNGVESSHFLLKIKTEMNVTQMDRTRTLTQSPSNSTGLYSSLPSVSTSEQLFLLEEDREGYIGTFNVSSEGEKGSRLELIERIPKNSWIIEKNGIPFLVDFDENPGYREKLAGTYGCGYFGSSDGLSIAPSAELRRDEPLSSNFIPESDYRFVAENRFVTVFMAVSDEKNHFYPVRVLPELRTSNRNRWRSFKEEIKGGGHLVGSAASIKSPEWFETLNGRELERKEMLRDPGMGTGGYLYYDVGKYHGPERSEHTLDSIKRFAENFHKLERWRGTADFTLGLGAKMEVVEKAGLTSDFLDSNTSERENLFLAACKGKDRIDIVKDLKDEHTNFSMGSIATSVSILGKNRTDSALKWFEENKDDDQEEEFRSFLSYNETYIRSLPENEDRDYGEALTDLNESLGSMDFTRSRRWGVKRAEDLETLEYLKEISEDGSILSSIAFGVSLSALKALNRSRYKVDIDEFLGWMNGSSNSHHLSRFVAELNAGDHRHLPSFSFASRSQKSEVRWMPFGDGAPPLLLQGKIGFYNMTYGNSSENKPLDEIRRSINDTMVDVSKCLEGQKERAVILIELEGGIELNVTERKELRVYIEDRARELSPGHHMIGSVEVKMGEEVVVRYIHL